MNTFCELCGKQVQALQWGIVICKDCLPNRNKVLTPIIQPVIEMLPYPPPQKNEHIDTGLQIICVVDYHFLSFDLPIYILVDGEMQRVESVIRRKSPNDNTWSIQCYGIEDKRWVASSYSLLYVEA